MMFGVVALEVACSSIRLNDAVTISKAAKNPGRAMAREAPRPHLAPLPAPEKNAARRVTHRSPACFATVANLVLKPVR